MKETMLIETLLNKVYPLKSFVYSSVKLLQELEIMESWVLSVEIKARKNSKPICSNCGKTGSTYDTQNQREYQFISILGIKCIFAYSPRRVNCKKCGKVKIEAVPWSDSKSKLTIPLKLFLSRWARKMSWLDVAKSFNVSWESVFRSVKYVVKYGLKHRQMDSINAIGIDEIKYKKGPKYMTLVYQLDEGSKRLLFVGKKRKAKTLLRFFVDLGKEKSSKIKFVCTDMWQPYLKVIKKKIPQALNILDPFHIKKNLNDALDDVRRQETTELLKQNQEAILKNSRWALLKNPENLTDKQAAKIKDLLKRNLKSVKCYLYIKEFKRFWEYTSTAWAEKFFQSWSVGIMRSKIEPLKKKVRSLRKHKQILLNWHRAKGEFSSGPVEGLNNKTKVTMRKAYGFRKSEVLKMALFHQLGNLPEPPGIHRFC